MASGHESEGFKRIFNHYISEVKNAMNNQYNEIHDYIGNDQSSIHGLARANTVMRKTYGLLAIAFLVFTVGALAGGSILAPVAIGFAKSGVIGALLFLVGFYVMAALVEKNKHNKLGLFLMFAMVFFLGITITPLLMVAISMKGYGVVLSAGAMTAAVFVTMSLIGVKGNFRSSALANFIMVGFVVVLVGIVLSLFIHIPVLSLAVSGLMVIFSSALIMYQTKLIVEGGETSAVSATLTLFLAIYNIFVSLLNILMARD